MIIRNYKEVPEVRFGQKVITAVYVGTRLVHEALKGCFSKGFWINNDVWNNESPWKNS